jgi:hypothetical protein
VLANLSTALGPVPEDQADTYSFTTEVYGSTRMVLACLTKAKLAKVYAVLRCASHLNVVRTPTWTDEHVPCRKSDLHASLSMTVTSQVCSGWRCDMHEVLAPLRAVRPSSNGVGFNEDVVLQLRALNFDVPPPSVLGRV